MNSRRAKKLRQLSMMIAPAMKVRQPQLYRRLKKYWSQNKRLPIGVQMFAKAIEQSERGAQND